MKSALERRNRSFAQRVVNDPNFAKALARFIQDEKRDCCDCHTNGNCKHCGKQSLEDVCYVCRYTYPKPRKLKVKEDGDGLEIKPFEHIGSKY